MTLAAFLAAWALHLVAAASPGPAVLMAARTGVTEGFRTGMWLAFGLGLGALVWAVAALFGLAVLFQIAPALLWGFKVAGGLFLCWIAWNMWRHAADPLPAPVEGRAARGRLSALRLGLATQLANPKPAVFFGAVFVGTVPPGTSLPWIAALLFAVWMNEVICNILVARLFSFDRTRSIYARLKTGIDRAFGGILAVLGLKIAAT
ncbi:Threonine/homoserine/homoserine lactone efflux protein [Gemmobacter megaterium]|uniref:Threonine/homoserine/homoserine lactone efflux protein n=1 Tax=Gemmobacter megaterium TaxID=1086013 RepID=A0A1N7QIA6_9RHOB|nr:LysE family translocator [Gemmobacter megaterium]GGE26879.1 transporter [Gemmobacter megaterium]SIT22538.1 Threonine/homoserine/homoserine lactone efflux protein [Gemmobacter megaterium]